MLLPENSFFMLRMLLLQCQIFKFLKFRHLLKNSTLNDGPVTIIMDSEKTF